MRLSALKLNKLLALGLRTLLSLWLQTSEPFDPLLVDTNTRNEFRIPFRWSGILHCTRIDFIPDNNQQSTYYQYNIKSKSWWKSFMISRWSWLINNYFKIELFCYWHTQNGNVWRSDVCWCQLCSAYGSICTCTAYTVADHKLKLVVGENLLAKLYTSNKSENTRKPVQIYELLLKFKYMQIYAQLLSTKPSIPPANQEVNQPTKQPMQPTSLPNSQPTRQPNSQPTRQSTNQPNQQLNNW